MPTHTETRILPYAPQKMYDLVADVQSYPAFLPWCAAARVRSVVPQGQKQVMTADLVISFKVFREKFTSRVELLPDQLQINTEYLDGPFQYMKSDWAFREVPEGCEVYFHVDFAFKNAILEGLIGIVFGEAVQRMVRAFEARADALYGSDDRAVSSSFKA